MQDWTWPAQATALAMVVVSLGVGCAGGGDDERVEMAAGKRQRESPPRRIDGRTWRGQPRTVYVGRIDRHSKNHDDPDQGSFFQMGSPGYEFDPQQPVFTVEHVLREETLSAAAARKGTMIQHVASDGPNRPYDLDMVDDHVMRLQAKPPPQHSVADVDRSSLDGVIGGERVCVSTPKAGDEHCGEVVSVIRRTAMVRLDRGQARPSRGMSGSPAFVVADRQRPRLVGTLSVIGLPGGQLKNPRVDVVGIVW